MTVQQNICIDCGMCCDGTMFVELKTDPAFLLPCPAFRGGCCSIHETRPAICGAYRCRLLRRYERGEVSLEEARSLITSTMALRDRVRPPLTALIDSPESLDLSGLYSRLEEKFDAAPDPAQARREKAELLLDIVALRLVLRREFEPRASTDAMKDGEERPEPTAADLNGTVDRALEE